MKANNNQKEYSWFKRTLITLAGLTIAASVASYVATLSSIGSSNLSFCLTSKGVTTFAQLFSGAITILKGGAFITVTFATITGVYVALMTYINSVKSSSLSGHVSHINLFKSYIDSEIENKSNISPKSIDTFKWYRTMFPQSTSGDINISNEYVLAIKNILNNVNKTVKTFTSPDGGKYCYKKHQGVLISALDPIGIKLERLPKKIFFDSENDLFDLIDSVNSTFNNGVKIPHLKDPKRAYL